MDDLEFLIKLKEEIAGPAAKAKNELSSLQGKLASQQSEVAKLEGQMRSLNKADAKEAATLKELAGIVDKAKVSMAGLEDQIGKKKMASALDASIAKAKVLAAEDAKIARATASRIEVEIKAQKALQAAKDKTYSDNLRSMRSANATVAKIQSEQEAAAKKALGEQKKIKQQVDKGNAATIDGLKAAIGLYVALAAAIVAVGAALLGIAGKGAGLVLDAVEYKEETLAVLRSIKGVGAAAEDTFAEFRKISDELGISEKKASELGLQLLKAGTPASKVGDEIRKQIGDNGFRSVGGMVDKFIEKLVRLFEGVDIGPFKEALADLLALFDDGRPVAEAFKTGISAAFGSIFRVAAAVLPWIKDRFLDLVIVALKFYIWLNPIVLQFRAWLAEGERMKYLTFVLDGVVIVLKAIAAIIIILTGLWLTMTAVGAAVISALYAGIGGLGKLMSGSLSWFSEFTEKGKTLATDFIAGFVEGMKEGVQAVKDAVKGVGTSALDTLKGVFDSHSPSKKLIRFGRKDLMEDGLAGGIRQGQAAVDDAMQAATMPSLGAIGGAVSDAGSGGGGGSGSGGGVNVGGLTAIIHGVEKAEDILTILPEVVADMLENIAIQFGGSLDPEGAK